MTEAVANFSGTIARDTSEPMKNPENRIFMKSNNESHRRRGRRFAKYLFAVAVLLSSAFCFGPNTIAQTREWQPQRKWDFVVGTLQCKHRDLIDSFPQMNR